MSIQTVWDTFLNGKNVYESFSLIYNTYVNDMLAYGVSLGFDEETCRDAVHDLFCRIFENKKKLHKVDNIAAYLFRAYRNQLINAGKKGARIIDSYSEELPFTVDVNVLDSIISKEHTEKLIRTIEKLLSELTPRQREAIYLRYILEMNYEQIAEELDMNVNSARRLVFRGMESLRDHFSNPDQPLFLLFLLFTYYSPRM